MCASLYTSYQTDLKLQSGKLHACICKKQRLILQRKSFCVCLFVGLLAFVCCQQRGRFVVWGNNYCQVCFELFAKFWLVLGLNNNLSIDLFFVFYIAVYITLDDIHQCFWNLTHVSPFVTLKVFANPTDDIQPRTLYSYVVYVVFLIRLRLFGNSRPNSRLWDLVAKTSSLRTF